MRYQAVFFDFDGVILDSVHVKTEAFASMFREYGPEVEQAVVDYHLAHGGVSRFKKFEHYYKDLLHKPIDQETLEALGQQFNQQVLGKILQAEFIPGALESLRELKQLDIPAFVASGTPEEEIRHIVRQRGLVQYFLEVHGSPRKKEEIVQDIAARYELSLPDCLFVGDAMTDYEAAKNTGTAFLGIDRQTQFPPGVNTSSSIKLVSTRS